MHVFRVCSFECHEIIFKFITLGEQFLKNFVSCNYDGSKSKGSILKCNFFFFLAELRQTIRQEMENNRDCNDRQRIRFLISEGLERLKGLNEMLDMQGHC